MCENHTLLHPDNSIVDAVRSNCTVSDARDHGVYSMCSLLLKLRNLYKWENGIEPWEEPDAPDLLDWIDRMESLWESVATDRFEPLTIAGEEISPFDVDSVNSGLKNTSLSYGAGYGRSMKSVFFLAEVRERRIVEDCPVIVHTTELAREMSAPFAMAQDGRIIIRLDPLRYFLWDHFQELRSSCRSSSHFTLRSYGLFTDGKLDQHKLRDRLADIVERELDLFIYHEIGEIFESGLDRALLHTIIGRFPGSVIEFVGRAVKDLLADTHPLGLLAHISREKKHASLGLYVSFLDGLRQELFPEMSGAWQCFCTDGDWSSIESARTRCRARLQGIASRISAIAAQADGRSDLQMIARFNEEVLRGINLEMMISGADTDG